MHRSTKRANTPFADASRPPTAAAVALLLGAVYLWWRSSTLGVGSLLLLSLPVLAIEAWSLLELGFLTVAAWRLPPLMRRAEFAREHEPVDLAIIAAGAEPDEVERTLVACRAVRSRGQLVVIGDDRNFRHRALAADAGAAYRIDRRARESPGLAAHRNTDSDRYAWLEAGQLPMPDLIEVTAPRFDRPELAVCQMATSLLNSSDLAHLGRERDDDALVNQVLGPALSRWDAGLWIGSASIVRRSAIESIGGFDHDVPIERLVARLHRAGLATAFEPRRLVATTAPEAMDRYLAHRRQRAGAALSVVLSADGPLMPGGAMSLRQRLTHLGTAIRFGTGIRLLLLAVAVTAVLVSGVFPADTSMVPLVGFWAMTTVAGSLGRRALARGSMQRGDWVHQGWRVLGAEVAALIDVATGRVRPTATEREPTDAATGLRALAQLPLLDAVILSVDVALLVRALTIVEPDLLPPFPTGQRIVVFGFTLGLLVPIVRVLQVAVVRQQRRNHYRIPVILEATLDGTPAATVDVTPDGAGVLLPFEPSIGTTTALEISLPGADGVVRRIVGRALVRSARPDGPHGWRVGLELVQVAPAARQALMTFCARQPAPDDLDEAELIEAPDPVAAAEERRRRSVRRFTGLAGLAGLATVVFGPGVASASTADPALVEQVCVVGADGAPVVDVVVDRLVDGSAQVLGATDVVGCVVLRAVPETTGFAVTHRGARYELELGDYSGPAAEVALVDWRVRVVDVDANPVPEAEVRFFTDHWLLASASASASGQVDDGHRFEGLPIDPAAQQVEVRLDGGRFVTSMDGGTDRTVVLSRIRLLNTSGSATAATIDRGRGWEAVVDGMPIVPGRLVVRLADGEILRIDVPESNELLLPDGVLVPIEVDIEVEAEAEAESDADPDDPSSTTTTSVPDSSTTTQTTLVADGETPAPSPLPSGDPATTSESGGSPDSVEPESTTSTPAEAPTDGGSDGADTSQTTGGADQTSSTDPAADTTTTAGAEP